MKISVFSYLCGNLKNNTSKKNLVRFFEDLTLRKLICEYLRSSSLFTLYVDAGINVKVISRVGTLLQNVIRKLQDNKL